MLRQFSSQGVHIAFIDVAPEGQRPRRADPADPRLRLHPSHQLGQSALGRDADPGGAAGRSPSTIAATGQARSSMRPPTIIADVMARRRGQSARLPQDRPRRRDGLFDGRADRELPRARRSRSCVRSLILGGLGDRLVRGRGPAGRHRRSDGGALARQASPTRCSACSAPSPTRRRATARALAACIRGSRQSLTQAEVGRIAAPTLIAVGTRDAIAGDPHELAAMMPHGRGARHSRHATTISRSATGYTRKACWPSSSGAPESASVVGRTKAGDNAAGNVNTGSKSRRQSDQGCRERNVHGAGRGESRDR